MLAATCQTIGTDAVNVNACAPRIRVVISRNTVLSKLVQFVTWIQILGQNQIILNTNLVGWRHCYHTV